MRAGLPIRERGDVWVSRAANSHPAIGQWSCPDLDRYDAGLRKSRDGLREIGGAMAEVDEGTRFHVPLGAIRFVGSGLVRPESVLATSSGDLFTCDLRGVVARTAAASGSGEVLGPPGLEARGIKANGLALRGDGTFLFANVGREGGVWSLEPDGTVAPILSEVEGIALPSTNSVWLDHAGRCWIGVSTRDAASHAPSHRFTRAGGDGFIVLLDERGARIVGDGLGWTNECRIDPAGTHLYVNETFARRLTRFRLGPDGSLSARETVTEFGPGTWPDGIAFDQEGGAWITSIISNRLIRVDPTGRQTLVLEDNDPAELARVEEIYLAGELSRQVIFGRPPRMLGDISSLAFGGQNLRTIYLGSLRGSRIPCFRAAVAGVPPSHLHIAVR